MAGLNIEKNQTLSREIICLMKNYFRKKRKMNLIFYNEHVKRFPILGIGSDWERMVTMSIYEKSGLQLSIIVPFCNEESCIDKFYNRLISVLRRINRSYEMIFVDDGSQDRTYEKLNMLLTREKHLKIIKLRKNFGQSAALAAGFDHAAGEIIISLDGDLQHFPEDIPKFLAKIDEGYDIVSGWRQHRVDNYLLRRIPSKVANKMMALLSKINLNDFGTTFKAYRAEVIKNIHIYDGLHRFLPALALPIGVKIAEIPINNIQRTEGKSKYNLRRTLQVLFDLITVKFIISYMARPMQIFGRIGFLFGFLGFLICLVISYEWFFLEKSIQHNIGSLVLGVMLMIISVQFLAIGLISEMNNRIYHEALNQKIYHIAEIKTSQVCHDSANH